MKVLFTNTAIALLSIGFLVSSCSKHQQSAKTGITYNDKKTGGYERFRKTHPTPGPGLIPIEGGTFVMGGSADQDVTYDYNNIRRRVTVPSFYMDVKQKLLQPGLAGLPALDKRNFPCRP